MNCPQVEEKLLQSPSAITAEAQEHLVSCSPCSEKWAALQSTTNLLDEWQAPEPSPYFNTRLQAMLRDEARRAPGAFSWLRAAWLPRPVFGLALALMMAVGVGIHGTSPEPVATPSTGTPVVAATSPAIYDLQALENNHQLLADFDVLDDAAPPPADEDTAAPSETPVERTL